MLLGNYKNGPAATMSSDNIKRPATGAVAGNPADVVIHGDDGETPPVVVYQTDSYDADDEKSSVSGPSLWKRDVQSGADETDKRDAKNRRRR